MSEKKRVLYVGLDESNHGKFPEICVAVFSRIKRDTESSQFIIRHKDLSLLNNLKASFRDYRFLVLSANQIKAGKNRLSTVSNSLISPYLMQNTLFDKIQIYIDGAITGEDKDRIYENLETSCMEIEILGFNKHRQRRKVIKENGKSRKYYHQPFIIGLADIVAYNLYYNYSLRELNDHPKKVGFLG
ncbi:MAG: hypothetical protein WC438_01655 [Candidatus Pacearchaeota archaeon]